MGKERGGGRKREICGCLEKKTDTETYVINGKTVGENKKKKKKKEKRRRKERIFFLICGKTVTMKGYGK